MLHDRKKELQTITSIKLLMMILVVVYHSAALWMPAGWFNQAPVQASRALGLLADYLNCIHIYAFTFASGYLFHYSNYIKRQRADYRTIISKRIHRLLIPYFVTSVLWVVPFEMIYIDTSAASLLGIFLPSASRQAYLPG